MTKLTLFKNGISVSIERQELTDLEYLEDVAFRMFRRLEGAENDDVV